MKKSLIALAVLAASGAAMAQSSVTLFGIVDTGVGYIDNGGNEVAGSTAGQNKYGMTTSGKSVRSGWVSKTPSISFTSHHERKRSIQVD